MGFLNNKMNTLLGNIAEIKSHDALSLVNIAHGELVFTVVVIDTPETAQYLKKENKIQLHFKETAVSIARKEKLAISIQNRIPCKITAIQKGRLLCEIDLVFENQHIKSIITTNACQQLALKENDVVVALIKTNDISISPND